MPFKDAAKEISRYLRGKFRLISRHRAFIAALAIIVAVIAVMFGAKIFLFVNFLLGNDVVIKVEADKTSLSLFRHQPGNVSFQASVATNPFCQAFCESRFEDISQGLVVGNDSFVLKPGSPVVKQYGVEVSRFGTGQELYRFSMECKSIITALCHTSGYPTKRAILVAVNYELSVEELQLKETLRERFSMLVNETAALEQKYFALEDASADLARHVVHGFSQDLALARTGLVELRGQVSGLKDLWEQQDYQAMAGKMPAAEKSATLATAKIFELNDMFSSNVSLYNAVVEAFGEARKKLFNTSSRFLTNNSLAIEINSTIANFNRAAEIFNDKAGLSVKERSVRHISEEISMLNDYVSDKVLEEALKRELEVSISYGALCSASPGHCTSRIAVNELASRPSSDFDAVESCAAVDALRKFHLDANESFKGEFESEGYPLESGFWKNISIKARNLRQNTTNSYLDAVPPAAANSELILKLLVRQNLSNVEDYPEFNLTSAVVAELSKGLPGECVAANVSMAGLAVITAGAVVVNESAVPESLFSIDVIEPKPQCCVFEQCKPCCTGGECLADPGLFPVLFLHGHAFNRDVSADYSLDAFNKVQERLEKDGYLNAGAITLYTGKETAFGEWGIANVPLAIKASYYFDIFKEPENYVVVQTKSENIDTYAIRLHELIGTVQYKTGRPKVVIIASSMGGLVARRYVQIFGEGKVAKLILIGTPNGGIAGNVADFCPVIGQSLECRDMSEGSLFLNKLNRGSLPAVPIYSIVGTGCQMSGGVGDGIVLERNAVLEGANSFLINGTCSGLEFLHSTLLDVDKHPEVFGIILSALNDS